MERNHYTSMRKIILICMILVPFIPFIVALGTGYQYFTDSLEDSTVSGMKRIVGDHCHMIESFLDERKGNLEFIIQLYTFEALCRIEKLREIFTQLQKQSNTFVDLGIFNEDGLHVTYQGPYKLTGKIYKQEFWFKEVMKKGYYISDIFLGFRQVPHFIIAIVRENAGKKWVIRATIDTLMFNSFAEQVRIGKTGEAFLINKDGLLQTNRRSGENLMEKVKEKIQYSASKIDIQTFINKDSNGKEYLYATTWLRNKDWLLVVRQEKNDAFKALRTATYLITLISVLGGAAIIAAAFYLTDRIVRRMERMDAEREQLGQQLIRATRLAELGRMAAGFAHEINNPLQIIKSEQKLIEMILSDLREKGLLKESEDSEEMEDSIGQIKLQIDRCAKITQAILKFGRKTEPAYQNVDLRTFIPEIAEMVTKKASVHGIRLKREISEDTSSVYADPGELQQVLLNLFNNAIDAILEKHGSEGGELVIKAGRSKNEKVSISVRDNGCGINPEDQKNIFSPFFTTKPVGRGTGLGLSVCYGIIDSMGGVMDVSSEKNFGTTFTIQLPIA